MLFSSIIFLFYFLPIVLILYYSVYFSITLKNTVLLLASLLFYAWGEPWFVIIMILSIIMNYIFGLFLYKFIKSKYISKLILILSCIYNLGMLFIFKYLVFIVNNINLYLNHKIQVPNILLPIGISFFTFQAMSYIFDVYKGKSKVQKNLFCLGLYISFFPQLIAGPIVRYNTIDNQIKNRIETWRKFSSGCCRFINGLGKKVLLSNNMAIVADRIFEMNSINSIPVSLAWLGSIAYTLQIFFDFSGYSDMAIGLGLIFGFKFEENFNYPYISKSISEFWRRWHISLGTWFKDYVYFPLGGSRVSNKDKMIRNLFIVWLLTGIWHGAEWTFIIWGLLNFVFIAFEKLSSFEKLKNHNTLKHIYALFIINLGWVIFRAKNLQEAGNFIGCMFGIKQNGFWSNITYMFIKEYMIFFIISIILCMPITRKINKFLVEGVPLSKTIDLFYPFMIMALFILSMSYLIKGTYNPFIYFNF